MWKIGISYLLFSSCVQVLSANDDRQPTSATYNSLLTLTNDTKIIAAAEIGSVMEPDQLKAYQADWVYFAVWSGEYISGGAWNSLDLLKRIYSSDYVLTLDEIQGWKKIKKARSWEA